MSIAEQYLLDNKMNPTAIEPGKLAVTFAEAMENGLKGNGCLPMIPTYLSNDGVVPLNKPAVIIDAGGTNFRSALVTFTGNGFTTEKITKKKMPGIGAPATWEEFISFVADNIEELMPYTDKIGFCFSYSADITEDIDGKVIRIDKEVVITGSAGKLVGASLSAELAKRGYPGKRVVILNDTAAVLIGGSSILQKDLYDDFIGQVSGTGTNTCCILPTNRIGKLNNPSDAPIIVNLESGLFDKMELGRFDVELDKYSNNPGLKYLEKMTAGVYLGDLVTRMILDAAQSGLISAVCADKLNALGKIDSSFIDKWSVGVELEEVAQTKEDGAFIQEVCAAMFERSARLMCTNLLGILLCTGKGKAGKPVGICAEGSLVQKSRLYKGMLEGFLKKYATEENGIACELIIGDGSTVPGSAAAALLN